VEALSSRKSLHCYIFLEKLIILRSIWCECYIICKIIRSKTSCSACAHPRPRVSFDLSHFGVTFSSLPFLTS